MLYGIPDLKRQIRSRIKRLKSLQTKEQTIEKSQLIFQSIESLDLFKNSGTILTYWSIDDEVYTHDFILKWFKLKRIILPVIRGKELELKIYTGKENMVSGEGPGISEPLGETFQNTNEIDLSIIPGVAFDINKNRMGRGKAYYDKLLSKLKVIKIGVCFDFQLLKYIPVNETDVKMDLIVWNNGIAE